MAGRRNRLDLDIFPVNYVDPPMRKSVPFHQEPEHITAAAAGDWLLWGARYAKGARPAYRVAGELSHYALPPNVQGIHGYMRPDVESQAFTSNRHKWFYQ